MSTLNNENELIEKMLEAISDEELLKSNAGPIDFSKA